jgi:hypothetical protein
MSGVKIEEEGDPVIRELSRRIGVLEQQQNELTKALIATSLGLEVCLPRHRNLIAAIKDGRRVFLELGVEDGLTKIEYVIEEREKPALVASG